MLVRQMLTFGLMLTFVAAFPDARLGSLISLGHPAYCGAVNCFTPSDAPADRLLMRPIAESGNSRTLCQPGWT